MWELISRWKYTTTYLAAIAVGFILLVFGKF